MDSKPPLRPNLCVRPSFQVLDILEYACGLKLGPALTLNLIEGFETTYCHCTPPVVWGDGFNTQLFYNSNNYANSDGGARANAFESQYQEERFTTAYISFQPTETCALAPVKLFNT